MEKEKSSVDILKEIAKKEDWDINIQESVINSRYGHTTRDLVIKNYHVKDSYFISQQTSNFDNYRVYSGIFFPISGHDRYKLLISKRDFIDKLSFKKRHSRLKIGNSNFDAKINIETNNDIETHKLLSSSKVQSEVLDFIYKTDRLFIGFNEINPEFTKELQGKSYLSVFMSMEWILDKNLIDSAYKLGDLLRNKLI